MKNPSISEAFAFVVRKRRKELGLSQELLAEKANLHTNHISLIERNLRNPSLEVTEAIATGLGCSLTELIGEAVDLRDGLTKKKI